MAVQGAGGSWAARCAGAIRAVVDSGWGGMQSSSANTRVRVHDGGGAGARSFPLDTLQERRTMRESAGVLALVRVRSSKIERTTP